MSTGARAIRGMMCRRGMRVSRHPCKRGIRCNAILPGLIMTPAVEIGMTRESVEMILDHHLTPEAGRPEDIAAMVAFLASEEARYVTGQLISVDGGITSHAPTFADTRRMLRSAS